MSDSSEQRQPATAVMSLIFVAYCIFGLLGFIMLLALLSDTGLPVFVSLCGSAVVVLLVLTIAFVHLVRNPIMSATPDSTRLFTLWQIVAVGTCFGFTCLVRHSASPDFTWVGFVFEVIVVCFYLAYVGFSFALRRPPKSRIYLAMLLVLGAAFYAFYAARQS